jgi:PAS domain S-box-containing protein
LASRDVKSPRRLLGALVPGIIFLVLAALTVVVWHQEVATQRRLLKRHTDDVTMQGARRMALFVEFRLSAATLFAKRWATHEKQDYSRSRFEQFAQVFIAELPGVKAVQLVPPDLGAGWRVSRSDRKDSPPPSGASRALLEASRRRQGAILSGPQTGAGGKVNHLAAVCLRRGSAQLGYFLMELDTGAMIDACFHRRIRSEFSFAVRDSGTLIYRHGEEVLGPERRAMVSSSTIPVANRSWTLSATPRRAQLQQHVGWRSSLPVPILGLILSVTLALLVYLLGRRMELYRAARDEALREIEQRERAQEALRASEARYRSVFDSASDGFLVMNSEGRIIDANRAAAAMHGYSAEGLRGRLLGELIAPGATTQTLEVLRILAEHGPVRLELQDVRRDGTTLDVEMRGGQMVYDGVPAVLAIITDVTERRLAVQRHAMLARKVLVAQEEERARIARELHDELGQLLTALRLELDWVRKRGSKPGQESPVGFGAAFELVEKAAAELRRICRGLRPPLLDDLGVDPAVRLLVNEFKERTGIAVSLEVRTVDGAEAVPAEMALCVYRILQESLTNISRHAGASRADVKLSCSADGLLLVVSDDGKGFNPDHTGAGAGVAGMRERANLVNGNLTITSERGKGTRVEFRAPLTALPSKEGG